MKEAHHLSIIIEELSMLIEMLQSVMNELKELKTKEKEFLTIHEFAKRTGFHSNTIWKMIRNNEIKAKKISNRYLIHISELEKFKSYD